MEIQELIERIVAKTPQGVNPQFTFVLLDGQVKNMFGLDAALAFLFDRDLFLWKVDEVVFNEPAIPQLNFLSHWRIMLKKEDNK